MGNTRRDMMVRAKLNAYEEAIGHLRLADSDCDSVEEREVELAAFRWLAQKLDRECNRWCASLKNECSWPD